MGSMDVCFNTMLYQCSFVIGVCLGLLIYLITPEMPLIAVVAMMLFSLHGADGKFFIHQTFLCSMVGLYAVSLSYILIYFICSLLKI